MYSSLVYFPAFSSSSIQSGFFLRITNPSRVDVSGTNSSVPSSARSLKPSRTGVVCVWKPVIVLGLPAWPTVSTAFLLDNYD